MDEKQMTAEKQYSLKKQAENVSLRSLFRYATCLDLFLIVLGSLGAMANGASLPLTLLVFGNFINVFTEQVSDLCSWNFTALSYQYCPAGIQLTSSNFFYIYSQCNFTDANITFSLDLQGELRQQALYFVAIGCASIVVAYFQVAFWSVAAERQTRLIRQTLFRSIVRKEIHFFDSHSTGGLNTRLTDDVNKIHAGIGDKVGSTIQYISSVIAGFALGFAKGWKLTLVILSISPLLFISAMLLTKLTASLTAMELKSYGKAGAVAEEVLSSIRLVMSYNGQERERKRYKQHLNEAKRMGIRKGMINGLTNGFVWLVLYGSYALGFWYGSKLIRENEYDIGTVVMVFFAIVLSVFALGQVSPHLQALAQARAAAYQLWKLIDTPSKIDSAHESGMKKADVNGDIDFIGVQFSYPSRPGVEILKKLSFHVRAGETVALVGSSGSGKSTCVQLLQRFYDPDAGSILLDGYPIDQYNLHWLRAHLGVVSQEPVLFQTTIRENILFGLDSATDDDIVAAAKMANAHDFIMALPDKYETPVGERGATLSGGQKQRIAIARALLRNPKILLLDEATSALDNESEKIVQDALNRASQNRTTFIIAHRLSTIRHADRIIVMQKGDIIEEGNHDSLMDLRGVYFNLVEQQSLKRTEVSIEMTERPERKESISNVMDSVRTMNNKDEDGEKQKTSEPVKRKKNVAWEMLKMNRPEWCLIVIGCLACIFNGGVQPAFGVILSKLIVVFQECDKSYQQRQVLLFVLLFVGLGVISFCAMFIQAFFFACSGESLTKRLRAKAFDSLLRQEIAYFDDTENNTGALCTRLATEASSVQGASGVRLGMIFQNVVSLGTGVIISFVYSWQLTLLVLAFIPVMVAGGYFETLLITGFAKGDKKAMEGAGQIAVATIQNIRTVVQLNKEEYFHEKYSQFFETPFRSALKRAHIFGFFFGVINGVYLFAIMAIFLVGGHLINQKALSFENIMQVLNCMMFAAQSVGQTASLAPDYSKAIAAAGKILDLLDRTPAIDNGSTSGEELKSFHGHLQFNDVDFIYPNRPESTVLNKFNLKIRAGQRVAFVGTSGCGKSTSIQLIERFYDVNNGSLFADSIDIRQLNLYWYRSQLGIVFQEPVLFDMSIRENIAYGDNSRNDISIDEIIQAAKSANIHDFIVSLPEGYETNCGAKGTQLSGGQKQRIAIARALIRNPKILLLDEATSALDSESERIVQDALDRAQENRTSITIAHRLSTIQNADLICVFHQGNVVESGTHDELIARKGRYYQLAREKFH